MYISELQVLNYKSFKDSETIQLKPKFNILVGQNNVGKTALTEAFSLKFEDRPHFSRETLPYTGSRHVAASRVETRLEFDETEVVDVLAANGLTTFYVPWLPRYRQQEDAAQAFQESLREGASIEAVFESGKLKHAHTMGYSEGSSEYKSYLEFDLSPYEGVKHVPGNFVGAQREEAEFATQLAQLFARNVYNFSAIRFSIEDHKISEKRELAPDASNLVQVLHRLQASNPSLWARYLSKVRTVLSQIKTITFVPNESGRVSSFLWNVEPETERDDLAIPLAESGTGIGQILAILYVVFTSENSRTIIIDEPQSFLHPGAVRKLLGILKQFPQHQYVITTHSPTVVTASDPQALFLVRKQDEVSSVDQLDIFESQQQRLFLKDIGARLSDVFGADNILWVEGPTEEECFPLLLSHLTDQELLGTKIVAMLNTGDLEGKKSRTAFEIYERLSAGGGLLPPAIGFIFDLEQRDVQARKDLERQGDSKVTFIPRRMYENYLLNASAIAAIIAANDELKQDGGISVSEIEEWLKANGWDHKYFGKTANEEERKAELWFEKVHGAKLLKDLFEDLTDARITYEKLLHGKALTQWLIDNDPEDLQGLANTLEAILTPKRE